MSQRGRWAQISVWADSEAVDDLVTLFNRNCPGGAVVEEQDKEKAGPHARLKISGFLPASDTQTRQKLEIGLLLLGKISPISSPQTRILAPEDWAESWKTFFSPQHIGEHTVIVPTWRSYDPQPGEIVIRLDPGMAFGTGLHATTRLCLVAIERLLQPGMRVLDVGTGSGILAISAALQGAEHVQALDTDPTCVEVARDNAILNSVEDRVTVREGTLEVPSDTSPWPGHYDLLLVNILAEVIADMAPAIRAALLEKGLFVGSGIIEAKVPQVERALAREHVTVDQTLREEDWVALVGHKT
ncbi:MAG: 50S ribosomal protein L11 methyltransferase [Chloroflexota bacterium]|nr:50S ribosomal protein L11 methyltransferase [Chloroflexota bacterium]